jgi:hypothetical protein
MKFWDVSVRVSVLSVQAETPAQACAVVEKWLDIAGASLPGLACPSISLLSAQPLDRNDRALPAVRS